MEFNMQKNFSLFIVKMISADKRFIFALLRSAIKKRKISLFEADSIRIWSLREFCSQSATPAQDSIKKPAKISNHRLQRIFVFFKPPSLTPFKSKRQFGVG